MEATLGLLAMSAIAWTSCKLFQIKEESLLVIKDLGVEIKTSYMLLRSETLFIDQARILEVILNEGVYEWEVRFYMAIIIEGQDSMEVVFHHLKPRLSVLLPVYHGTRACLKFSSVQ